MCLNAWECVPVLEMEVGGKTYLGFLGLKALMEGGKGFIREVLQAVVPCLFLMPSCSMTASVPDD